MSLYDRYVLPRLLASVMQQGLFTPFRARIGADARGQVLELGIGSGLNLPFYSPQVTGVTGVDPSAALLRMAGEAGKNAGINLHLRQSPAEILAFDAASFDTVVSTWTMCTIGDPVAALREARRVLRPGGRLLFAEHGLSPDAGVARWQHRITPVWRHVAGNCHANRAITTILTDAGFAVDRLETGYVKGPKPLAYMYAGSAAPR